MAVRARDLDFGGREILIEADSEHDGLLPVALQHELDHLKGIVFVEKLGFFARRKIRRLMAQKSRQEAAG